MELRRTHQSTCARVLNGAQQVLVEGTRRAVPIGTSSSSFLQSISPREPPSSPRRALPCCAHVCRAQGRCGPAAEGALCRQADRQIDRQTDRQTRQQTDRHAGRHTHSLSVCVLAAEVVREQRTYRDEDDDKMVVEPPVDRARVPSPDAAARAPSPSLAAHQPCPSVALLPAAARTIGPSWRCQMRVLAGQRSACCPRDYFSWVSDALLHPGKIVPWRATRA